MTLKNTLIPVLIVALAVIAFILPGLRVEADSVNQIPGTVATTTNPTVTSTASVVFATSTCVSRTISTVASPIMITFSDAYTPTATFGILQAASTTQAYDASQYGCGRVRIYSYVTSAITVQETR